MGKLHSFETEIDAQACNVSYGLNYHEWKWLEQGFGFLNLNLTYIPVFARAYTVTVKLSPPIFGHFCE